MFSSHHPQDIYTYPHPDPRTGQLHRARSVVLPNAELVEIRATQRTFEGAYVRTSLSQFSFALVVLRIFTAEFYSIGALFAVYGAAVLAVGWYRRKEGNRQFFVVDRRDQDNSRTTNLHRHQNHTSGDDGHDREGNVAGTQQQQHQQPQQPQQQQQHQQQDEVVVQEAEDVPIERGFRTSGNVVLLLTIFSVMAYATLLVLTLRLGDMDKK